MMIVLDALKDEDPNIRRISETWMRCSLKSYFRYAFSFSCNAYRLRMSSVLDPILYDLLSPSIRKCAAVTRKQGKELSGFCYERPFDQRYISHVLDILLSLVRFGGQGLAKTAKATTLERSFHAGLIERARASKMIPYKLMCTILTLFLKMD